MSITIGPYTLANPVILAPMSGISDLPFREAVRRAGAGMVVSEMVASEDLARQRPEIVLRAEISQRQDFGPNVIQLAGRDAYWMAQGAIIAQARGADIIDINMGCPARQVTGHLSGSALMRDLDHAITLIEAVIENTTVPVTLKMRLGWDDSQRNAPELAQRAQAAGVQMLTVHGRTRQQFYKGKADWRAVREVVEVATVPVVVNGDIVDDISARAALEQSGAQAVMLGRAAEGRPWLPGAVATALLNDTPMAVPAAGEQIRQIKDLYLAVVTYYEHSHSRGTESGLRLGVRTARKHLAAFADHLPGPYSQEVRRTFRRALCRATKPEIVVYLLEALADEAARGAADGVCENNAEMLLQRVEKILAE